mmetsp:Transcript_10510/g.23707  ORF Transcript_10510/g.23707 Transcript_10510/m.23707 type:complete len:207 (+) Transcript_10510:1475-2095(+)
MHGCNNSRCRATLLLGSRIATVGSEKCAPSLVDEATFTVIHLTTIFRRIRPALDEARRVELTLVSNVERLHVGWLRRINVVIRSRIRRLASSEKQRNRLNDRNAIAGQAHAIRCTLLALLKQRPILESLLGLHHDEMKREPAIRTLIRSRRIAATEWTNVHFPHERAWHAVDFAKLVTVVVEVSGHAWCPQARQRLPFQRHRILNQ